MRTKLFNLLVVPSCFLNKRNGLSAVSLSLRSQDRVQCEREVTFLCTFLHSFSPFFSSGFRPPFCYSQRFAKENTLVGCYMRPFERGERGAGTH